MPDSPSELLIVAPETDAEREAYFALRWRLLRAPWGQPRGSERDAVEGSARHLLARTPTGEIIGVGRVHLAEPGTAQIRYLAVMDAWHRCGVGTSLLEGLEAEARRLGAHRIIAQVREAAVPFYRARGYTSGAAGATLFGSIRHIWMTKTLDSAHADDFD